MVVGALLSASIQAYYRFYDPNSGECAEREITPLMDVWNWVISIISDLVTPAITLVLNILIIRGVRKARMANAAAGRAVVDRSVVEADLDKSHVGTAKTVVTGKTKKTTASKATKKTTTVMLLSISFFFIATTLPVTLIHVIHHHFPKGDTAMSEEEMLVDQTWNTYFIYQRIMLIAYELSTCHYACNFFIFMPTGWHFRQAVIEFLTCKRSKSDKS
jgi:hypothetical protein